jgi:hypothetical protein
VEGASINHLDEGDRAVGVARLVKRHAEQVQSVRVVGLLQDDLAVVVVVAAAAAAAAAVVVVVVVVVAWAVDATGVSASAECTCCGFAAHANRPSDGHATPPTCR